MAPRWILRKGTKRSGFRYTTAAGHPVRAPAVLARIEALRIPPAWTDVHVAAGARSAVQAWGFDAKGRRQYRYHDQAIERGELRKHHRVRQMAHDLPAIRAALGRDFGGTALSKTQVTAGVVRLIEAGFFRVGGERYAKENRTFGITTLRKRHTRVERGCVYFEYVGKRSIRQRHVVADRALARFVARLLTTPGQRLFRYLSDEGEWADLTARDVNEYLHQLIGVPYTAKDFRTWGGTLRLATVLADIGPATSGREAQRTVATAVRLVAAELGNTPAICRKSYVHPIVIARYLDDGDTIWHRHTRRRGPGARRAGGGSSGYAPEERALIEFLDRHFPERRRRPRVESAAAS